MSKQCRSCNHIFQPSKPNEEWAYGNLHKTEDVLDTTRTVQQEKPIRILKTVRQIGRNLRFGRTALIKKTRSYRYTAVTDKRHILVCPICNTRNVF